MRWRSQGSPHLAALVPVDAMSNPGRFGIRYAGAFELRWLNWVLTLGNPNLHGLTPDGRRTDELAPRSGEPTGRWLLPTGEVGTADDNAELRERLAARAAARGPGRRRCGGAERADDDGPTHPRGWPGPCRCAAGATALRFAPDYEAWLVEAMRHGDDDAFWADMGINVVDTWTATRTCRCCT